MARTSLDKREPLRVIGEEILGDPQNHSVNFHCHERRLAALELNQRALADAIASYVAADVSVPWLRPAKNLLKVAREISEE